MTRKVFAEVHSVGMFKDVLGGHIDAIDVYKGIISPVSALLDDPNNADPRKILRSLQALLNQMDSLLSTKSIAEELILPKYFPWPNIAAGPYSTALLANKETIRRTANFNLHTLLFSSSYLEIAIFLIFQAESIYKESE